ncbi:hypothetical protein GUITHDRAFT_108630 [Guillardia theta CCMP2712]|uniref:Uncharacterized protein n=2 Tax=Guillardia theta TaxID=55529 RepID=L1JAN6_GUITC|nr:hypothetical protein GUITHDRAFT_108630 [Guillardia theta CCMP2712]EKX45362.1 hypothetical protein GUITHDRAFT_108630 [Guillardia theta CCMP2712]|eukprot:XP_005832342.1 hypothetical protein GUITHDRAFT_108630 [Guillardia theta CCMP2712]
MSPLHELILLTWKNLERQVSGKAVNHGDGAAGNHEREPVVRAAEGDIGSSDIISGNAVDYLLHPLPLDRANKLIETQLIDYVTDAFANDPGEASPTNSVAGPMTGRSGPLCDSADSHRTKVNGVHNGARPKAAECSRADGAGCKSQTDFSSSSSEGRETVYSNGGQSLRTSYGGLMVNFVREHSSLLRIVVFISLCYSCCVLFPAHRASSALTETCRGRSCHLLTAVPTWSNYSARQLALPFNPLSEKMEEVRNNPLQQNLTAKEHCDLVQHKISSCNALRSMQATDLLHHQGLTCWNCDLVGASMLCERLGAGCPPCQDKLLVLARSSANGLRLFRSICSLGPALTYRRNFLKGRSGAVKEQWKLNSRYPHGYGGRSPSSTSSSPTMGEEAKFSPWDATQKAAERMQRPASKDDRSMFTSTPPPQQTPPPLQGCPRFRSLAVKKAAEAIAGKSDDCADASSNREGNVGLQEGNTPEKIGERSNHPQSGTAGQDGGEVLEEEEADEEETAQHDGGSIGLASDLRKEQERKPIVGKIMLKGRKEKKDGGAMPTPVDLFQSPSPRPSASSCQKLQPPGQGRGGSEPDMTDTGNKISKSWDVIQKYQFITKCMNGEGRGESRKKASSSRKKLVKCKSSPEKELLKEDEASGSKERKELVRSQSMLSVKDELEGKSTYMRQVMEDRKIFGEMIEDLIPQIEEFESDDFEDLQLFVQEVEKRLSLLVDERMVLKGFAAWPDKRMEVLREANGRMQDLKQLKAAMDPFGSKWIKRSSLADELQAVEDKFASLQTTVEWYARSEEELKKNFAKHRVPFDFRILLELKEVAVSLAKYSMQRVLGEIRPAGMEGKQACHRMQMLLQHSIKFAFRCHQFAGGFDEEASALFGRLHDEFTAMMQSES